MDHNPAKDLLAEIEQMLSSSRAGGQGADSPSSPAPKLAPNRSGWGGLHFRFIGTQVDIEMSHLVALGGGVAALTVVLVYLTRQAPAIPLDTTGTPPVIGRVRSAPQPGIQTPRSEQPSPPPSEPPYERIARQAGMDVDRLMTLDQWRTDPSQRKRLVARLEDLRDAAFASKDPQTRALVEPAKRALHRIQSEAR